MSRFFRKSLDQNENKKLKCKDFEKWEHQYNDYQMFSDEKRHELLLNYFKDAMLISRDTNKVTVEIMRFIRDSPIISDPSLIGGHAAQNKKRLSSLRQCFTAEFLHVLKLEHIQNIKKTLVMHHTDEERESTRRKEIIALGGDDFKYSTLDTPCLARKRSIGERKRKASVTSPIATPKSKEEKNTTIAKKLTSGIKAIIMTPLQMFSRKKRPTDYDSDNNFESPNKRRRFNDDENLSRLIANTTKSPLATIEDKNEESTTTFSPDANEMTCNLLSNDDNFSTNSDVESGESAPPSTPNAYRGPLSNDREPASSSESNSSPESSGDNTGRSSSANLSDRQIKRIGDVVYSLLQDKSKGKPDTIARTLESILKQVNNDSNLISSLDKRTKEDEMNAQIVNNIKHALNHEMFQTRGRRNQETNKALIAMLSFILPNKFGFVIFGNGKRDRDHLSDKEYSTIKLPFNEASLQCSKDTISRYQERFSGTSFDSFQSDELVLPVLKSEIDKETNMVVETIELPFGTMHCTSEVIDEYNCKRIRSTTTSAVQKHLNFRSTLFEKAEEIRIASDNGINVFEDEEFFKQSVRWDDIDNEIEKSVYNFGHDPTYVSPDNYCKTKYKCRDESGRPCKHNRSNWCLNGDKHMQLKLYLESEHFSKLKSKILRERPQYAVKFTDQFFLKKVHFRKFCSFLPNCVKPETRASCVDPIEAEAYDFSRGLQLFFRGIKSNMKPVAQEAYYQLNGGIDLYDPNAESEDDDSESDTDEVEFVSDTTELRKTKVEQVVSASREFYDRLDTCTCEFCRNGKGWLDVFSNIKGRRPHIALLDNILCERTPQPELSIQGEKLFQMHNYKCACLECEQCGLDKLPFTCPVTKSDHKIKLWIWEKSKGDNERTKKVEMPICEVFTRLRDGLEKFSRHNHLLQLFSRFRSLEIHRLSIPPSPRTDVLGNPQRKRQTVLLTDFSAQIDMVPFRKVNCHVNRHASLDIFVQFFQNFVEIDREVIYYVECFEWYFFGGCEEKGKQNDWVMHNVSFNAIFEDPEIVGLKFAIVKAISDNSPYQYKCRQNFWQLVLKTLLLLNISRIFHNFAKQYGFKNRSDTCGHFIKIGVEKMKSERGEEPHSAVEYAQLAHMYVNKEEVRPDIELLLEKHRNGELSQPDKDKLKKMLKDKSPYACTKRRVAYVEDNEEKAEKCKKELKKKFPGLLVVYSDRKRMKEEEDCNAIDDTTAYYSFSHKREDDGKPYESFPVINQTVEGKFLCRVCRKEFGSDGKPFKDHENVCKILVDKKQKHCLYMRFYDCSCNQCADENFDQCPYKEYAGEEKVTWMHSEKDEASAKAILKAQREISQQQEIISHATEALNKMKECNGNYPPIRDTVDLKKNHWSAITNLCNITVTRNDGKTSEPTIDHKKNALANHFESWGPLLETLEQAIAPFQNDMNDV